MPHPVVPSGSPDFSCDSLTAYEHQEGGEVRDVELFAEVGALVRVKFHEDDFSRELNLHPFDDGVESLTRAAPRSPHVHEDGDGGSEDDFGEGVLGHVGGHVQESTSSG